MQLDDFHKLAHQAHFGPAHMVPNTNSALEGLHNQVNDLGDGPAELMFDPITPDASVVGIHLSPYLAYGGTLEQLANGLQRTADEFMKSWGLLVALASQGFIPFSREEVSRVWQVAESSGFAPSITPKSFRKLTSQRIA